MYKNSKKMEFSVTNHHVTINQHTVSLLAIYKWKLCLHQIPF